MPIIDLFRFLAATLVLLAHYKYIFGVEIIWEAFAPSALSWFFVMSGFILSYRYPQIQNVAQLKKFYLFRLVRIYPLYFLAVLVGSLLTIISYGLFQEAFFTTVGRSPMGTYDLPTPIPTALWIEAVIKHLFFIQIWSDTETLKFLLNPPLWSISNEAFFYLCFPILLLGTRYLNKTSSIVIALILAYGFQHILVQLLLPPAESWHWFNLNTTIYTNPFIRIVEFIIGMILYQAYFQSRMTGSRFGSYWLLGLILILYIGMMAANRWIPMQYTMFLTGLPIIILMIYVLVQVNWQPQGLLRRVCVLSGGVSYVIYSLHWPIMELCRFIGLMPKQSMPFLHTISLYLVIVLFSFTLHLWLEEPLRQFILRQFGYKR